MDCSPPSSSVRVISQASIRQWVAISFPCGSSQPRDQSHIRQVLYHWATKEAHIYIYIYITLFIHSPNNGHLGCFHLLVIENNATVNTGVQIYVRVPAFNSFGLYTQVWFSGGTSGTESACQCRRHKRHRFYPGVRKIPWRMAWQSTPLFLPGKSHQE